MLRNTAVVVLAGLLSGALAGCESTPEPPDEVAAAQALRPDESDSSPALNGIAWQPVDFLGCPVPWGLPVMVEPSGIARREFTFTSAGSIRVRQVEVPQSPDTEDVYSLAYSRQGRALHVRAGLGIDTWTIRELTTARLMLEDENGQQCWLRRVA